MTDRVALYLQDAHRITRWPQIMSVMLNSAALRLCGRPKAVWCGMQLSRWQLMPR